MNYLDRLFDDIEQRYGDAVDWTTLGRLATPLSASSPTLATEKIDTQPVAYRAAAADRPGKFSQQTENGSWDPQNAHTKSRASTG
jgi:hypothetical protein